MTASPKARETGVWKWLKGRLPPGAVAERGVRQAAEPDVGLLPDGTAVVAERVENLVASGTPDVKLCVGGRSVYVELKACARPVYPATPLRPDVRDSQLRWHARWLRAGACTAYLLRVGSGPHGRVYALSGALGGRLAAGLVESEVRLLGVDVTRSSDVARDLLTVASSGPTGS